MRGKKIVLTGGPCAGKTTGLAYLCQRLSSLGYRTFLVPESATIAILGGANPSEVPVDVFQAHQLRLQIFNEDHFASLSESFADEKEPVFLCDRGAMDGKAFCSPADWKRALAQANLSEDDLRSSRYDGVIHMVSAAIGAESHYTLENNDARQETVEQAAAADYRVRAAWLGHHKRLRIVDNSTDFTAKISRVGDEVCSLLGISASPTARTRYALPIASAARLRRSGIELARIDSSHTYLAAPSGETREIQKWSRGSEVSYFCSIKRPAADGQTVKESRVLNRHEYSRLLSDADPSIRPVCRARYCYIYDGCHHEMDVFHSPKVDFCLLTIESMNRHSLPLFLVDAVDVTNLPGYSQSEIASCTIHP